MEYGSPVTKLFSFSEFCAWEMVEVDESTIREFITISGGTREEARFYLESHTGSLSRALDSFYSDHAQVDTSPVTARPKRQKTAPPKTITTIKEIDNFFVAYAAPDAVQMDPSGISRLSSDLGIDPLDVVWLYIACQCDAHTMGIFSKAEWDRGMSSMGTGSVTALKDYIPEIRNILRDDSVTFKKVYMFTFKFSLEPGARNLPTDTALELWKLLLPFSGWTLYEDWIQLVIEQSAHPKYRAVTKDLWSQLLDFIREYPSINEVRSFDSINSAWPNLIDEFCERHRKTP